MGGDACFSGQRFNQVVVAFEDFAHRARGRSIALEIQWQEDCVRTQAFGPNSGRVRMHSFADVGSYTFRGWNIRSTVSEVITLTCSMNRSTVAMAWLALPSRIWREVRCRFIRAQASIAP